MSYVKTILSYLFALIIGFVLGYGWGLSDNGTTADEVRGQLKDTQTNQSTITEGIGNAASTVKDAGGIIDESIYILRGVRSQPASQTEKN